MVRLRRRLGLIALLALFVFVATTPCFAQRRIVVGQKDSVPASAGFLFDWAIDGLNARLNPVEVDAAILRSYAGDYGPRHLRVESGRLLYNRDDGVPVKLIGHCENGHTDENPRDQ
jgi:hypothetical protein